MAMLLAGCKENKPEDQQSAVKTGVPAAATVQLTEEQVKNGGIVVQAVEKKDMQTLLKVNGTVDVAPQNVVSISMPLGGYLKSMKLLPGMQIRKGQVLAVLEDPQYIQLQQDFLVARSRLGFLEADFGRQKELNESKVNSDKTFQQVRSDYESQKVIVRSLAEKLQLIGLAPAKLNENNISRSINIHAPISGYIAKVNVNTGKYVSPTDILFELIDPADLHLSLTVFEKDMMHLAPGQKVSCYTAARPKDKYAAKVHLITRNIDEDRAGEVHCHFDQYNRQLLPGMFMNAEIELTNANVTAVPDDAVVKWENKHYIFTAEAGNTYTMIPVETGAASGGFTEIRSPLPGKQVVIKNAYTLLMKLKNSSEEE